MDNKKAKSSYPLKDRNLALMYDQIIEHSRCYVNELD